MGKELPTPLCDIYRASSLLTYIRTYPAYSHHWLHPVPCSRSEALRYVQYKL